MDPNARIQTMVLAGCYTLAASVVLVWSTGFSGGVPDSPLAGFMARPAGALAIFLPMVLGLLVQLIGRRFWAWPYVYLLVFCQTLPGVEIDFADQVYGYVTALVWILTVFAAESCGLAAGRFINRYVGIAFFFGSGSWLFFTGLWITQDSQVDQWHAKLLVFAGALFYIHTGFQLAKFLADWRPVVPAQNGITDDTRPQLPVTTTVEAPVEQGPEDGAKTDE